MSIQKMTFVLYSGKGEIIIVRGVHGKGLYYIVHWKECIVKWEKIVSWNKGARNLGLSFRDKGISLLLR